MILLRLSHKLNTEINAGGLIHVPPDDNPYADWSCHLFTANRTPYVMLSNTQSLYSCVMDGKGITDDVVFIQRAMGTISDFMEDDGLAFLFQRFIIPSGDTIGFAKALNRSVVGSMNELIRQAKLWLSQGEMRPHEVGFRLNDALLAALRSGPGDRDAKPRDAFKTLADAYGTGGPESN